MHAAFHRIADGHRHPAGAVVGAGTVVLNPASELGEHEHQHVVRRVVLPKIGVKVPDPLGELPQQHRLGGHLVGVGVETALLSVEDTGPQIRQ